MVLLFDETAPELVHLTVSLAPRFEQRARGDRHLPEAAEQPSSLAELGAPARERRVDFLVFECRRLGHSVTDLLVELDDLAFEELEQQRAALLK